ncbi:hypothetical protein ACHQM5_025974 [Ranunculus cassubicifolius]
MNLLILLFSILIFFPFNFYNALQPSNHACSYTIQIETTCATSAGTKDPVGIRFGDSNGNLVIIKNLKNPKMLYGPKLGTRKQWGVYRGFERCAVDMYEVGGVCMSQGVCSLYVKQFGADGWRPGWVKVLRQEGNGPAKVISDVFYFRRFVPQNVWFGLNYCDTNKRAQPQTVSFVEDSN